MDAAFSLLVHVSLAVGKFRQLVQARAFINVRAARTSEGRWGKGSLARTALGGVCLQLRSTTVSAVEEGRRGGLSVDKQNRGVSNGRDYAKMTPRKRDSSHFFLIMILSFSRLKTDAL